MKSMYFFTTLYSYGYGICNYFVTRGDIFSSLNCHE